MNRLATVGLTGFGGSSAAERGQWGGSYAPGHAPLGLGQELTQYLSGPPVHRDVEVKLHAVLGPVRTLPLEHEAGGRRNHRVHLDFGDWHVIGMGLIGTGHDAA
jgi:hypothetical protein